MMGGFSGEGTVVKDIIFSIMLLGFLVVSLAAQACENNRFLSCLEGIYWLGEDPREAEDEPQDNALPPPVPVMIEHPAWIKNAVSFQPRAGVPLISLVIDDMGLDQKRSAKALTLPPEVTMAYLPYSRKIKEQTAAARAAGHELIVHMPMEPEHSKIDPGVDYLSTKFSADDLSARVRRNLAAFDGYIGVNNHMGSKFTQNHAGMEIVMQELRDEGLMFLDSKTINHSVAEKVARENDIPTTHRDVFLDDEETEAFTEDALQHVERIAKSKGSVIAIGHPRDITLRDLKAWIPTLEAKGFQLAPLSAVLKHRMEKEREEAEKTAAAPLPLE